MSTQLPQIQYFESPEVKEVFADAVRIIGFENNTWRIEFVVNRTQYDQAKPPALPPVKQYPVCRLVLPVGGGLDLINRLGQVAAAMEQQGLLKRNEPKPVVDPGSSGPH